MISYISYNVLVCFVYFSDFLANVSCQILRIFTTYCMFFHAFLVSNFISYVKVCMKKKSVYSAWLKRPLHFHTHSVTAAWPLLWRLSRKQPVRSPQSTAQTRQRKPPSCGWAQIPGLRLWRVQTPLPSPSLHLELLHAQLVGVFSPAA